MNTNKWASYWSHQSDPRHAINQDAFFKKIAQEVNYHLGELSGKKVLEIGCGDGALLKFLGIAPELYKGVDFSEPLLDKFRLSYPEYQVEKKGAIEYLKQSTSNYDIIFSFGVLQYFNKSQLKELFNLQREVINNGGFIAHFGVPVKEHKGIFAAGKGTYKNTVFESRSRLKRLKSYYSNNIGYWHSLNSLHRISESSGFKPYIYGGMHYFYRVNLLQKL